MSAINPQRPEALGEMSSALMVNEPRVASETHLMNSLSIEISGQWEANEREDSQLLKTFDKDPMYENSKLSMVQCHERTASTLRYDKHDMSVFTMNEINSRETKYNVYWPLTRSDWWKRTYHEFVMLFLIFKYSNTKFYAFIGKAKIHVMRTRCKIMIYQYIKNYLRDIQADGL